MIDNSNIKICFDVDGTLIEQDPRSENVPRYEIIQLFQILRSLGCDMYIWSGDGVDYAARWAEKLGLKAKIVPKGSFKPDIAVDDLYDQTLRKSENSLGDVNIQV